MEENNGLREAVNKSGFPLQLAVAHLVSSTKQSHGFRTVYTEHAWTNPEGQSSGFLDLVLENQHETSVLIIECKRVLDADWIFLCPIASPSSATRAKAWVTYASTSSTLLFDWYDLDLDLASRESEYCVVPRQDTKTTPMLERIAADLVDATEALAAEERKLVMRPHEKLRMYFSLVVTTARLRVCNFDAAKVDVGEGKLTDSSFEDVPFIRFRKQLSTRLPASIADGWDSKSELVRAKEHTVFVVNSESLQQFLANFQVSSGSARSLQRQVEDARRAGA